MKKFAIGLFAVAMLSVAVETAEAGLFGRWFGRRGSACGSACTSGGCWTCRPVPSAAPRATPAAPQRTGCYTLPNGVRVCPVR